MDFAKWGASRESLQWLLESLPAAPSSLLRLPRRMLSLISISHEKMSCGYCASSSGLSFLSLSSLFGECGWERKNGGGKGIFIMLLETFLSLSFFFFQKTLCFTIWWKINSHKPTDSTILSALIILSLSMYLHDLKYFQVHWRRRPLSLKMIKELSSFCIYSWCSESGLSSLIKMDERMLHGSQRSSYIQENLREPQGFIFPIHHRIWNIYSICGFKNCDFCITVLSQGPQRGSMNHSITFP